MCQLCHKVRNGQNIPPYNKISSFSNFVFQIKIYIFILGFQRDIASIHLKKNTLGLYVL